MDQVALRLSGAPDWHYVGGKDDARKPLEVVLRAFDRDVEFAIGDGPDAPTGDIVSVPAGEGRRLEGRHFFVRPAGTGPACRVSYRGL